MAGIDELRELNERAWNGEKGERKHRLSAELRRSDSC